jgi:molybdopterin/thiamine biosynthesis adenylyltransferase/rhodanese-related sulfurtransferase
MKFPNVTVNHAYEQSLNDDCEILDVRTAEEWQKGIARNSQCLSLADIEANQFDKLKKGTNYLVICRSGIRSLQAIEKLHQSGFAKLSNIDKGFEDWQKQKLPIEKPQINTNDLRYQRHYQLSGFGRPAQDKLLDSHVLLIGAGGLGSPSALYLAAAGVGEITIIDDDKVSLSNLQRQIIHTTTDCGHAKVESAKHSIQQLNPDIKVNAIAKRLNETNIESILKEVDLVIDGSDNLSTRYLVNDVCFKYQKPLVYAAVYQYEAQLTSFDFRNSEAACLRCLFPQTEGFEPANCTTEGVLGVVPGLAGVLQASEAIKLITGIGEPLTHQLQIINLLDNSFNSFKYKISKNCTNSHI